MWKPKRQTGLRVVVGYCGGGGGVGGWGKGGGFFGVWVGRGGGGVVGEKRVGDE